MLILGFLFAFVMLLAGFISMAIRGSGSVHEMTAWVVAAGSFVLAGALAPRRSR